MALLEVKQRPRDTTVLVEEVAPPTVFGARAPTFPSIATGITPSTLGSVLQRAAEGDNVDLLTLAEEMEERDPHIASVLQTRKLSVSKLELVATPASDDARDVEIAAEVQAFADEPPFRALITNMMDAISKGYSISEIMWEKRPDRWVPVNFIFRDPRHFRFDPFVPDTLRLRDDSDQFVGITLPDHKFVCHVPRIRSGLPSRGGLSRTLAAMYLAKSMGFRSMMIFSEIFGIPLRIGTYGKGANKEDIKALKKAVRTIGIDATAVIAAGTAIEFKEAPKGAGGAELYKAIIEMINGEESKAVLGQTMTTEDGSSLSQATIHEEVRQDIIGADAKNVAATITKTVFRSYVTLNHGPDVPVPAAMFLVESDDDIEVLGDAIPKLVTAGLRVASSDVRDRLGLREPEDDEEIMGGGSLAATPPRENDDANALACPLCSVEAHTPQHADMIDVLQEDLEEQWEALVGPLINPVLALVAKAKDAKDFRRRLPQVLAGANLDPMVAKLAQRMFEAHGIGDATDNPERR